MSNVDVFIDMKSISKEVTVLHKDTDCSMIWPPNGYLVDPYRFDDLFVKLYLSDKNISDETWAKMKLLNFQFCWQCRMKYGH